MERRTFFKNLLGAGIVAALPKPMFDAIVQAEEEKPTFINPIEESKDGFWIFNDSGELLIFSRDGNITAERPLNIIEYWDDDSGQEMREYAQQPMKAHLELKNANVTDKFYGSVVFDNKLKFVFIRGPLKCIGDCYCTDASTTFGATAGKYNEFSFSVCGEIIIEEREEDEYTS